MLDKLDLFDKWAAHVMSVVIQEAAGWYFVEYLII